MRLFRRSRPEEGSVVGEVDKTTAAYEEALRLIDSEGKWGPEKTKQLVAVVQPVAPSFTEEKVGEWLSAVVFSSVSKGGDPDTEIKQFLRRQIDPALDEFKRLRNELR